MQQFCHHTDANEISPSDRLILYNCVMVGEIMTASGSMEVVGSVQNMGEYRGPEMDRRANNFIQYLLEKDGVDTFSFRKVLLYLSVVVRVKVDSQNSNTAEVE